NFQSLTGKGVTGQVGEDRVAIGNALLFADRKIDLNAVAEPAHQRGETVLFVAINGKLAGMIAVADPLKPSTPDAINALKQSGLRLVMLTGDNQATAAAIAQELGIREYEAELLPETKSA